MNKPIYISFRGLKLHRYLYPYDIKVLSIEPTLEYGLVNELVNNLDGDWEIPTMNFLSNLYTQVETASRASKELVNLKPKYHKDCNDILNLLGKKIFWSIEEGNSNYQYCVRMNSECTSSLRYLQPKQSKNNLLVIKRTKYA